MNGKEDAHPAEFPIRSLVAAVSTGVIDGTSIVDLNYEEDKLVSVDFNMVATETGDFMELQGSGEAWTFKSSSMRCWCWAARASAS